MKKMQTMRIIGLLGLSLMLAIAGCKKDKKGKSGESLSSAFKMFPSTTQIIFGIDGSKLREASKFEAGSSLIEKMASSDDKLAKLKECGLDPIKTLKSLVFGGSTDSDKGMVVLSGIPRSAFKKCSEAKVEDIDIKEDGDFTIVKDQPLLWLDDDTAIGGKGWTKSELKARKSATSGADTNKDLMALLAKVDTKSVIWGAGVHKANVPMIGELEGFFGSVELSENLSLDVGAKSKDEASAKKQADGIKGLLPMAKSQAGPFGSLLDKVQISSSGDLVKIQVSLTQDEVKQIANMAQSMAGPMLGR